MGKLDGWRKDAGFALTIARRRPIQVLLQVTNRCNMTCDFCDFWPNGVAPAQELSTDDFRRLARELDELGTMFISVEGGEPLVRKDILDILRALSRNHVTCLYTNGWFVTPELARGIFDAGVSQVGVSIDYPDAADHDRRRGITGATTRAWRAVEQLRAAAPHGGRQIHVMTVLMDDTAPGLERLLAQSRDAGVGHWITLVSASGYRRGKGGTAPARPMTEHLLAAAALRSLSRVPRLPRARRRVHRRVRRRAAALPRRRTVVQHRSSGRRVAVHRAH